MWISISSEGEKQRLPLVRGNLLLRKPCSKSYSDAAEPGRVHNPTAPSKRWTKKPVSVPMQVKLSFTGVAIICFCLCSMFSGSVWGPSAWRL